MIRIILQIPSGSSRRLSLSGSTHSFSSKAYVSFYFVCTCRRSSPTLKSYINISMACYLQIRKYNTNIFLKKKEGRECNPKGQPTALKLRHTQGPGKGPTILVYCTQSNLVFLRMRLFSRLQQVTFQSRDNNFTVLEKNVTQPS